MTIEAHKQHRQQVRAALVDRLGPHQAEVAIDFSQPKPQIKGSPAAQFNYAHTGSDLVLATVNGASVGVDIERRTRLLKNWDLIRKNHFHVNEQDWIRSHGGSLNGFLQIWCLKEAWVKAIGGGVLRDFQSFSVIDSTGEIGHPNGWLALSDAQPDLYVAVALARPGIQPEVRWLPF